LAWPKKKELAVEARDVLPVGKSRARGRKIAPLTPAFHHRAAGKSAVGPDCAHGAEKKAAERGVLIPPNIRTQDLWRAWETMNEIARGKEGGAARKNLSRQHRTQAKTGAVG